MKSSELEKIKELLNQLQDDYLAELDLTKQKRPKSDYTQGYLSGQVMLISVVLSALGGQMGAIEVLYRRHKRRAK